MGTDSLIFVVAGHYTATVALYIKGKLSTKRALPRLVIVKQNLKFTVIRHSPAVIQNVYSGSAQITY